ncbi:MAG: cyclic lactone autoinducer peptide [Firmicutes bacterium]|nr:cyclic lactone autoinducer peptide [Bacillota bacterium]
MKKILILGLNLISMAIGTVSLFAANMSIETMSLMGMNEPEMPTALRAKGGEESVW